MVLQERKKNTRKKEIEYLDKLVRGVYAAKKLKKGDKLQQDDFFMAIPLQHGQLSCRELVEGEIILEDINPNDPIKINQIDTPYGKNELMLKKILKRGFDIEKGEEGFKLVN